MRASALLEGDEPPPRSNSNHHGDPGGQVRLKAGANSADFPVLGPNSAPLGGPLQPVGVLCARWNPGKSLSRDADGYRA